MKTINSKNINRPFNLFFLLSLLVVLTFGCRKKEIDVAVTKDGDIANTPYSYSDFKNENIEAEYSMEQLDNTKGLSNSSVNCIFQDSQKLLWVGTWDGLNRYDGKRFKIFRPEQAVSHSLSNQVVTKIFEDASGSIWILTNHGINRYDKSKNQFDNYYFSRQNMPPLSESEFNIALNGSGEVFCAVKDWGVGYFDGSEFVKLKNTHLQDKAIVKTEFAASGQLLLLTDSNELYAITIENKSKTVTEVTLVSKGVQNFSALPDGGIALITASNEIAFINLQKNHHQQLSYKGVKAIVGVYKGGILFTGKNGFFLTDFQGNELHTQWLKFLRNQKITSFVSGTEDILWAGTDGDGLFKIFPDKKAFSLVNENTIPELDGGIVRSFLETDSNTLWIGTKGKGVFRITAEQSIKDAPLRYEKFDENSGLSSNAIYALSKGKDELIFIGSDGKGISVFDKVNNKIFAWDDIEGSADCDYFKSVYTIYADDSGFLWLGTNGYGMVRCKISRNGAKLKITDFKIYKAGKGEGKHLSSNIIFSILPKDNSYLWIGTRLGGLNLFDKNSEDFIVFKNNPADKNSLSNNDILCLAKEEKTGRLWIGTSFGLNVLEESPDVGAAKFKSFTVKDGLPNNTIHGIVPYGDKNLWISTNLGLSNYSSSSAKFTNYSVNDGLQNNEFADGAFYKSQNSETIFFGGIKGFNYFNPQRVKESRTIPDLLIDKVTGQNEDFPYFQGLVISPNSKSTPSLTLKHNENFFDVHMGVLTFLNNEKCKFAYQLKGFDEEWKSIGNRDVISFTNVPHGNYKLWMKWTNADGIWSQPIQAIDITITPVFWQTNTAIVIYVILLISFLLFVKSYYLKRQSLSQSIVIRKKEEELHENRLVFFTNIAHEFLTPLTLIVGPVQKLAEVTTLDERSGRFVKLIERNAARLLILTQQLLEFRKMEHEEVEIQVKEFDLVSLLEQIAELFDDWALEKKINYNVNFSQPLLGWYDKDKIEKIIFNLMSNAFKYTPHSGKIDLDVYMEGEASRKIAIKVTNTGKGIPKEKLDSLFDRFFLSDAGVAIDPEVLRTGIGLAYIKKLVTILGGEITVSSVPDVTTTLIVYLPCSKESFKESNVFIDQNPIVISSHLKSIVTEIEETKPVNPEKVTALEQLEKQQPTILIVEDDKEIHIFLNQLLGEDYSILTAYNGLEALKIMESKIPDLIISDVMMPLMDGVELCKKVKSDLSTCNIPFIMLTAKESVLHRIEGLESGANSYIPKPFYPKHLQIRIQKLLEEKEKIGLHFLQDQHITTLTVDDSSSQKDFIKEVIEVIRKSIDDENLQSALIEKTLGISTSQLYRKTKDAFGLSPGELIRIIRLKYAAELLRKNEMTVSEVCYKSGFNNRSYFYREFKKVYSTTPKNYQMDYKNKRLTF